jgi:hypothetical protein
MAKTIKACFIDAENQTISEVTIEDSLFSYYKLIKCEMIEVGMTLVGGDVLYVDEEGLLKKLQYGFYIEGARQVFVGNAVIVGTNLTTGETISTIYNKQNIEGRITFLRADAKTI